VGLTTAFAIKEQALRLRAALVGHTELDVEDLQVGATVVVAKAAWGRAATQEADQYFFEKVYISKACRGSARNSLGISYYDFYFKAK
jgi:hypothetical protein